MNIGNFELNGYAALAPMAGVTDRAFRELCMEFGSAYCTSEMVSSKGLIVHDRKSELLINMSEKERPCEVQIFGNDPAEMALAAKKAEQTGCFAVDINMGCPAPKVAAHGSGSALMKNPELAGEITNACVNAVGIPVTCKIRSGWDEDNINAVETAKILEKAGASAITVHGRTRRQMYAPPVNLDIIRRVKEAVNIPVIGNGDIFDCRSALEMYEKTKCDFAAIGRGALGNPWIFSQINSFFETGEIPAPPGIEERMTVMINHIVQLCEYKGDYVGIREARKHAGWYIKGIRGAASFRREIGSLESTDDLRRLAENVIKSVMNEGEN